MPEDLTDRPMLTGRFDRALELATDHHRSQLRTGTRVPYLAHVLAVASLVLEMGGGEDEAIAALLHDAVKDDGRATLARIREEFGYSVADIVAAVGDTGVEPEASWRERQQDFIDAMPEKSRAAIRVALADALDIARSIVTAIDRRGDDHAEVWSRFSVPREDVCWYYDALATAFEVQARTQREDPFTDELRRLALAMAAPAPTDGILSRRLTWVQRALSQTRAWAEAERAQAAIERIFMAPTPEYDFEYAYDAAVGRATAQADQTIAALEAERDYLVREQTAFDSRPRRHR